MSLLAAVGVGLVSLSTFDRAVSSHFRSSMQALYAAEAMGERVVLDLASEASWTAVVSGYRRSSFSGAMNPRAPWGELLDVQALTEGVQRQTRVLAATGERLRVWVPYAWGSLDQLVGDQNAPARLFLLAWVADDVFDGDVDPATDANGRLVILAMAVASGGIRRTVQIIVERPSTYSSVTDDDPQAHEPSDPVLDDPLAQILPPSDQDGGVSPSIRLVSWREVR